MLRENIIENIFKSVRDPRGLNMQQCILGSFFISKESKFKVNVFELSKIDKITNFDRYEI